MTCRWYYSPLYQILCEPEFAVLGRVDNSGWLLDDKVVAGTSRLNALITYVDSSYLNAVSSNCAEKQIQDLRWISTFIERLTLKNKLLFTSKTSWISLKLENIILVTTAQIVLKVNSGENEKSCFTSPWGSLFMSPTLIVVSRAHDNEVDVGSSKKFFWSFSLMGRSKSAKYIVTPSNLGSLKANI